MADIGEPIRRHEIIPIENEPVQTPIEPKAPVIEPAQPTAPIPEKVPA